MASDVLMADEYRVTNMEKARTQMLKNAAIRATDDPAKLAQAARIVQTAIERGKLTVEELVQQAEQ